MSTARARLMRRGRRYLAIWKENIGLDNELGLTDINSDAEDFCCGLLSIVLDAHLQNLNLLRMNFPAIDLADKKQRICVQVTSTEGAEKITHTLDRFFAHDLNKDYDRLIVMILGKKRNYRKEFLIHEGFDFDPARDIWDIPKLLTQIAGLTMPQLQQVDDYLREQFSDLGELTPPMDLPVLSALDDNSFFGREEELDAIAQRFERNEKVVFLSGLGGMGKSELAIRFAQTRWGSESYFVHFTGSWRQTVLENIALSIRGLNRDNADENRIYRDAMAELKSRGADELLILDNVDQEKASLPQLKRDLSELSMRVLITTRTEAERAIAVDTLPAGELHRLFELHQSVATQEEQAALIRAVDGHTLTVDLMARALRPGRRAATAEKLLDNLSDRTIRQVDTAYPGGPKQARIMEHLKVVFQVSRLDGDEMELLRYATLLPVGGMADDLFLAPIEEDMEDALDSLIQNGWLQWKDGLMLIHPVIRKVCMEELAPNDSNCVAFLSNLCRQYDRTDYQPERYSQIAEMLSNASVRLVDTSSWWAAWASHLWHDTGNFENALAYSLRTIENMENYPLWDDSARATFYNHMAGTYSDLGDYQNARKYHQKALVIRESMLSTEDPDLATSLNCLGCIYGNLGEHTKALEYQHKALLIREKSLAPDDPDLARSYHNVGCTLGDLGRYRESLEYQTKGLAIREKLMPEGQPDLAVSYSSVGITYGRLGEHNKALEYQLKALQVHENVLPVEHPDLAHTYNNVGSAYLCCGNHEKALEYFLKALAIQEKVLPSSHPHLALSCSNIAWVYHKQGSLEDAAQYMRRAESIIYRSSLPQTHPYRLNIPALADQFVRDAKMAHVIKAQMQEWGMPLLNLSGKIEPAFIFDSGLILD